MASPEKPTTAYHPIDPEIDKWTPFPRNAVPSSDAVSQQAGVVCDAVVFRPSDATTVTVPMLGTDRYVVAGSSLSEAGERPSVGTRVVCSGCCHPGVSCHHLGKCPLVLAVQCLHRAIRRYKVATSRPSSSVIRPTSPVFTTAAIPVCL